MRLVWVSTAEDLNFLKSEKRLKVIYNFDVLRKSEGFKNDGPSFYDSLQIAFQTNFNKVSNKKFFINENLQNDSCNYILKVTFVKFELFEANYSATPSQNGYPGSRACSSEYVKGYYMIYIINSKTGEIICSFSLSNLTNKYPIRSSCSRSKKYSQNINVELNRSMFRAGTETAKYMLKLRKK